MSSKRGLQVMLRNGECLLKQSLISNTIKCHFFHVQNCEKMSNNRTYFMFLFLKLNKGPWTTFSLLENFKPSPSETSARSNWIPNLYLRTRRQRPFNLFQLFMQDKTNDVNISTISMKSEHRYLMPFIRRRRWTLDSIEWHSQTLPAWDVNPGGIKPSMDNFDVHK